MARSEFINQYAVKWAYPEWSNEMGNWMTARLYSKLLEILTGELSKPRLRRITGAFLSPLVYTMLVTIHAPTWGATRINCYGQRIFCCFNPRAHAGRDAFAFDWLSIWLCTIYSANLRRILNYCTCCKPICNKFINIQFVKER